MMDDEPITFRIDRDAVPLNQTYIFPRYFRRRLKNNPLEFELMTGTVMNAHTSRDFKKRHKHGAITTDDNIKRLYALESISATDITDTHEVFGWLDIVFAKSKSIHQVLSARNIDQWMTRDSDGNIEYCEYSLQLVTDEAKSALLNAHLAAFNSDPDSETENKNIERRQLQAELATRRAEITQTSLVYGGPSNKEISTEVPSKLKKLKTDDEPPLNGATNTTHGPTLTESAAARELDIKLITEQVTRSLKAQMAKDFAEQTKKIQEEAANKAKETTRSKSPAYYQGRQTRPAFYNQRQRRQPFYRNNSRSRSRSRYNRRSRSRDNQRRNDRSRSRSHSRDRRRHDDDKDSNRPRKRDRIDQSPAKSATTAVPPAATATHAVPNTGFFNFPYGSIPNALANQATPNWQMLGYQPPPQAVNSHAWPMHQTPINSEWNPERPYGHFGLMNPGATQQQPPPPAPWIPAFNGPPMPQRPRYQSDQPVMMTSQPPPVLQQTVNNTSQATTEMVTPNLQSQQPPTHQPPPPTQQQPPNGSGPGSTSPPPLVTNPRLMREAMELIRRLGNTGNA